VSEGTIGKRLAELPPKTLEPGNQYNTVEINRAFDEMTIVEGSLPSLNRPHEPSIGEATQEQSVVCDVATGGEFDRLGEQNTLPVDQLETLR
jgi:hypothetical protein